MGTLIVAGALGQPAIGFQNWNIPPGPINNGLLGVFSVYTTAFFSYGGTELVGITAGEALNPRKSVPKAINGTFWRITIFYVLSLFIVGLLVPYNDPQLSLLSSSKDGSLTPFTLALEKSGIMGAAHVMNAVILIAALSAANSSLYATSRTMMAMADEGKAPKIFARTTSWGVPIYSLALSVAFGLISFLGSSFGSNVIFVWLTNLTGMASYYFDFFNDDVFLIVVGLITWMCICVIHIRFRKAYVCQGFAVDDLPYKAPFFPYGQYLAIFMGLLVLIGEGYSTIQSSDGDYVQIVAVYVGVPFYLLLYLIYKFWKKSKVVLLESCDLKTGIASPNDEWAEWDEDLSSNDTEKEGKFQKGKAWKKFKKVVDVLA